LNNDWYRRQLRIATRLYRWLKHNGHQDSEHCPRNWVLRFSFTAGRSGGSDSAAFGASHFGQAGVLS
jgi:hypothetical protein